MLRGADSRLIVGGDGTNAQRHQCSRPFADDPVRGAEPVCRAPAPAAAAVSVAAALAGTAGAP